MVVIYLLVYGGFSVIIFSIAGQRGPAQVLMLPVWALVPLVAGTGTDRAERCLMIMRISVSATIEVKGSEIGKIFTFHKLKLKKARMHLN